MLLSLWLRVALTALSSCEACPRGAALFPGELISSLPPCKGGVGLVHVPTQVQAAASQGGLSLARA